MDEIKNKILTLLNKQNAKIPSMGFSDSNYQWAQSDPLSINSKTCTESDRPADQDILEGIEAAYFSMDPDFDIARFELTKLPEKLDSIRIQEDFKNLKRQHQVVSKKVLQLILQNQNAAKEELGRIVEIKEKLGEALQLCRSSRSELNTAKNQFSSSLTVLANYRKRKLLYNLLGNLNTIKTLHHTEYKLKELLDEENYAGAIELLQECQAAANTYRHFTCVAALTNKLQETLEETEEKLMRVLAQMCFYFDTNRYGKLQAAYKLLGKTQIAMDHLHMHYTSAIYSTALNIVRLHGVSSDNNNDNSEKKPYDKLCSSVTQEAFIPCLVDVCKSLFKIIISYHRLYKWHNKIDNDPCDKETELEENINRQYVKQKLENGLLKIWHDVQSKISLLLANSDLSSYKFDQFLQILSVIHRLIEVGEEFCGSKSEELQESIKKQSLIYFRSYHMQRMDELKIFFEHESWEICPVKHTFDILQLHEFKSLRSTLKNFKLKQTTTNSTSTECGSSTNSQDGSTVTGNYLLKYSENGTPFDGTFDTTVTEEDILVNTVDEASGYCSEETDEESDELHREFVDEEEKSANLMKKHRNDTKSPILTNTTLTVLRHIGKYLQMSRLLEPIAFDIILCMIQLFEYYLYTVNSFFASDLTVTRGSLYTVKLNATLSRIDDSLSLDDNRIGLNPLVDLKRKEELYGLSARIIGVEGLIYLGQQFEILQEYLEYLVPSNNRIIVQQFFNQTIKSASDLRKPVYMCVAARIFDLNQVLLSIAKIGWEIKEVMSQHNSYVDMLLREVQLFSMRLEEITVKIPLSIEVSNVLWENIAHIVTHTLVQGFSEAKKCSNGGRALMQLDFTQFLTKFEKISKLRPVPHKEYVENYVKAYYLPEIELEKWIREHSEYSSKHLLGLVSCVCQNNKKSRQRLSQLIDELERKDGSR